MPGPFFCADGAAQDQNETMEQNVTGTVLLSPWSAA
jgi:hypothetical protein